MNNITLEQVEKLRAHANVSFEDARDALEKAGGDMLEAIIRLEKEGKTQEKTGFPHINNLVLIIMHQVNSRLSRKLLQFFFYIKHSRYLLSLLPSYFICISRFLIRSFNFSSAVSPKTGTSIISQIISTA